MKFKRAALREFQDGYVTDPSQPCIAFRSLQDTADMSLSYQFVKHNGQSGFAPDMIHRIASPDRAELAQKDFLNTYGHELIPVGETYCVAPYVMGYARFGKKDKSWQSFLIHCVSQPEHFATYVDNWLETPEGYERMLADISQESPEHVPVDEIKEHLTGKTKDEIDIVKFCYIDDHVNTKIAKDYVEFVKLRMDEFRQAFVPIEQCEVNARVEHYFNMSVDGEIRVRERNIADYKNSKPLIRDIKLF